MLLLCSPGERWPLCRRYRSSAVRELATVILAGFFGTIIDSLLGAIFERRGLLDNNLVNLLSTCGSSRNGVGLGWYSAARPLVFSSRESQQNSDISTSRACRMRRHVQYRTDTGRDEGYYLPNSLRFRKASHLLDSDIFVYSTLILFAIPSAF